LDGVEHVLLISPRADALAEADLTAAERGVAEDLLRGLGNRQIAARRGVSLRTVANQVAAIFVKLGVSSRAQLAATIGLRPETATGRARGRAR
jgi:DNA-binding NarL/FixJ family response regulator